MDYPVISPAKGSRKRSKIRLGVPDEIMEPFSAVDALNDDIVPRPRVVKDRMLLRTSFGSTHNNSQVYLHI